MSLAEGYTLKGYMLYVTGSLVPRNPVLVKTGLRRLTTGVMSAVQAGKGKSASRSRITRKRHLKCQSIKDTGLSKQAWRSGRQLP